jgi:hypothetical protein
MHGKELQEKPYIILPNPEFLLKIETMNEQSNHDASHTMAEVIFYTIMIVSFVAVMVVGYFAKRNNERSST